MGESGLCRYRYFALQKTVHYSIIRSAIAPRLLALSAFMRRGIIKFRDHPLPRRSSIMDIDRDHIDEAILALLFLGRHDGMSRLEILRLGRDGTAP